LHPTLTCPPAVWLATLIFGRDASLGLAAIYYRWTSLPSPKTFTRYWDFSLPSAEVHPTTVSKFNTFLQLGLVGTTLALPLVPAAETYAPVVTAAQLLVAGTTAWSGASYVWDKKAVTILGGTDEEKRRKGRKGRLIIGSSFAAVCAAAAWLAAKDEPRLGAGADVPEESKNR
jgi:cardiolipin synthase (CMP-forming)